MSGVDVLGSFHMKQSQSTDPYHLMSSMCFHLRAFLAWRCFACKSTNARAVQGLIFVIIPSRICQLIRQAQKKSLAGWNNLEPRLYRTWRPVAQDVTKHKSNSRVSYEIIRVHLDQHRMFILCCHLLAGSKHLVLAGNCGVPRKTWPAQEPHTNLTWRSAVEFVKPTFISALGWDAASASWQLNLASD